MTTKDTQYGISTCQTGCTIYERGTDTAARRIEILPTGNATTAQIKSIAYQLLAMVGE